MKDIIQPRNRRNGSTRKRVLPGDGPVEATIPRDREARFDPVLIGKYRRRRHIVEDDFGHFDNILRRHFKHSNQELRNPIFWPLPQPPPHCPPTPTRSTESPNDRPHRRCPTRPPWSPGMAAPPSSPRTASSCCCPPREAAHRLQALARRRSLVHAPATFRRLGLRPGPAFDLLELFAFVLPARTAAPTPRGLALALDHDQPPTGLEAEAACLPDLATALLHRLSAGPRPRHSTATPPALAARMGARPAGAGRRFVTAALDRADAAAGQRRPAKSGAGCRNGRTPRRCRRPPPCRSREAEARARLAAMLGPHAEQRPGQADYAGAAAAAFAPARDARRPASGAGRGRHRHRQDARLPRPRQPLGARRTTAPSGSAPSPATCSARSTPSSPACSPTRPSAAAASWCARGARTTSAC